MFWRGATTAPGGGISSRSRRGPPAPRRSGNRGLKNPVPDPPAKAKGIAPEHKYHQKPPGFPSWSSSGHSLHSVGCLPSRTRGLQQCVPHFPRVILPELLTPGPRGTGAVAQPVAKLAPSSLIDGISRRGWGAAVGAGCGLGDSPRTRVTPAGRRVEGGGYSPVEWRQGEPGTGVAPTGLLSAASRGGARRNRAHFRGPRGSVSSREGGGPREGGCPCPRTLATPLSTPFPRG